MIDYIRKAIISISEEINNRSQNNMYLLYGDEGIGKTTIVENYPKVWKNALSVRCGSEFDFASLISKINPKKNYDRNLNLYQPLIKKIKKQKIHTLIFDVESNADEDFFDLIDDIFNIINQRNHRLNIVIVLDNKIYHHNQKIFAKYKRLNYLLPLKKWETSDFFQLWQELYGNITPDREILELIASYSLGNVGVFLKHLNMLKFYGILSIEDNGCVFKSKLNIEEILKEEYSEIVRIKYESLGPELQTVIKKTSVIGYIFKKNTLKEVFDIQNAKTVLKHIELLTKLLYYTDAKMETGRFDSEEVQLQIEKMIEPGQLTTWCAALAEYYENKTDDTGFVSLERCALKEKCIIYYTKAKNTEKMILHCLSLIPLKYNLGQYNSAIDLIKKLISVTKSHSRYKRVYSDCFYMMTAINRTLANCTIALDYLNKYIELIETETTEIKGLKAELLYGVGDTPSAYSILRKLYKSRHQIDDPHLKVSIISMLSSIEETLNDGRYIKHFNEAIHIAKENKLYREYYTLLRKSNMAHSGENGIVLMRTAEKYFEGNNIISELIMVRHNIGTESLFYETTYKYACIKLNAAYEDAEAIGFSKLSYIKNSLSIYSILEGDYQLAINILDSLLDFQHEDFTLLALYLNKVTALRKLGLYSEARACLDIVEQMNSKKENLFPFFTAQIIMQLAYLYLEINEYYKAYLKLREYFKHNFEDRTSNIISAKITLKSLCDMQNIEYPPEIIDFSSDYDNITKRMADNHLVLCELMFWE